MFSGNLLVSAISPVISISVKIKRNMIREQNTAIITEKTAKPRLNFKYFSPKLTTGFSKMVSKTAIIKGYIYPIVILIIQKNTIIDNIKIINLVVFSICIGLINNILLFVKKKVFLKCICHTKF